MWMFGYDDENAPSLGNFYRKKRREHTESNISAEITPEIVICLINDVTQGTSQGTPESSLITSTGHAHTHTHTHTHTRTHTHKIQGR